MHYKDAKDEAILGYYGGTPQQVAERKIIKEVVPFEAEVNLEIAKKQKRQYSSNEIRCLSGNDESTAQ